MRCELKRLHSPDVLELQTYRPDIDAPMDLFIQAFVGISGEPGEEAFGLLVCNPLGVQQLLLTSDGCRWGHGLLIVDTFDYEKLWRKIDRLCRRLEAKDWKELYGKLQMYMEGESD